jgi:hypothetical protein
MEEEFDLVGVKKRLEDYEKMLQYYTLMRMKNKMKDSKVEFEEWWEVAKEYFTKELEKNLAHRKVDERIYKLKIYQKNFLDFVYGNPTSKEASNKDEEAKVRPSGIPQE